jgi:hypothetical protein
LFVQFVYHLRDNATKGSLPMPTSTIIHPAAGGRS